MSALKIAWYRPSPVRATELTSRPRTSWPFPFTTAKRAPPWATRAPGTRPSDDSLIDAPPSLSRRTSLPVSERLRTSLLASERLRMSFPVTELLRICFPVTTSAYAEPPSDMTRATQATTMAGDGSKRRNIGTSPSGMEWVDRRKHSARPSARGLHQTHSMPRSFFLLYV